VEDGDAQAMDEETRKQLASGYENMRRSLTFSAMVESQRARADIVIPDDSE
jgi:hypothetical protein